MSTAINHATTYTSPRRHEQLLDCIANEQQRPEFTAIFFHIRQQILIELAVAVTLVLTIQAPEESSATMSNRIFNPATIGMPGLRNPEPAIYFDKDSGVFCLMGSPMGASGSPTEIAVFTDGACANNGRPGARGAYGVYFGGGTTLGEGRSLYSKCGTLCDCCLPHTNQMAELEAVFRAVDEIMPTADGSMPDVFRSLTRVVVILDSDYVFRAMTDYIYRWEKNGFKNARGRKVNDSFMFRTVQNLLTELETDHMIQVQFWRVDRKFNGDADDLAKQALQFPRYNEHASVHGEDDEESDD